MQAPNMIGSRAAGPRPGSIWLVILAASVPAALLALVPDTRPAGTLTRLAGRGVQAAGSSGPGATQACGPGDSRADATPAAAPSPRSPQCERRRPFPDRPPACFSLAPTFSHEDLVALDSLVVRTAGCRLCRLASDRAGGGGAFTWDGSLGHGRRAPPSLEPRRTGDAA